MMDVENALKDALKGRGIASLATFEERYGVPLPALTFDAALDLLRLPDHPRARDRATWTPMQRRTYGDGCLLALAAIRGRLERGLLILSAHPTVAAEVHWLRLATRATRIIGKASHASMDAGTALRDSALGRWYYDLDWPVPSDAALTAIEGR